MQKSSVLERVQRRHRATEQLRAFFVRQGFWEVESSALVVAPTTEPHIDPLFVDLHDGHLSPPKPRYLRTSPELALKRMLAAGVPRIFELAKVFRDGERGPLHLPEFVMLEWYRAAGTLDDLVVDLENLFRTLAIFFHGEPKLIAPDGSEIDVGKPFPRTSVASLFETYADVDLRAALVEMADGDPLALVRRARAAGHALREQADFEDAFFHIMVSRIEPQIGREAPLVVDRWPRQMAVLSKLCEDDPLFAGRFELYAGGIELANAFDELTDPVEQRERFLDDNRMRVGLGKKSLPIDEEFLRDLGNMPDSAGIALGWDRLLMMLFGEKKIDDVQVLAFR